MDLIFPRVVSNIYPTAGASIPNPSRSFSEGIKADTIIFSADSGYEQRRKKSDPKRTFQIVYNVLTSDQYKTIRDFFMVVLNTYSFSWTHPLDKSVLNVRFTTDTFLGENFSHGANGALYKIQFSLEQVW